MRTSGTFWFLDIPGSSSYRDKVLSFGFKYNRDYFGTNDGEIYIDEMFLGPAIKPTINGQNITVRLLSVYKDSRIIIKYKNVTAPSTEGVYTLLQSQEKNPARHLLI